MNSEYAPLGRSEFRDLLRLHSLKADLFSQYPDPFVSVIHMPTVSAYLAELLRSSCRKTKLCKLTVNDWVREPVDSGCHGRRIEGLKDRCGSGSISIILSLVCTTVCR